MVIVLVYCGGFVHKIVIPLFCPTVLFEWPFDKVARQCGVEEGT